MIKVGFICEGYTEQILLRSNAFTQLLNSLQIEPLPIINAEGSGNLLPHNISGYTERLEREGAKAIVILTDLDEDICITKTKKRIAGRAQDVVVIAVKKIEAWFLACSPVICKLLQQDGFTIALPEQETNPFETINKLLTQSTGRGIGKKTAGKIKLANKMIELGFDLPLAAAHKNCPSAAYFLRRLTEIGAGAMIVG